MGMSAYCEVMLIAMQSSTPALVTSIGADWPVPFEPRKISQLELSFSKTHAAVCSSHIDTVSYYPIYLVEARPPIKAVGPPSHPTGTWGLHTGRILVPASYASLGFTRLMEEGFSLSFQRCWLVKTELMNGKIELRTYWHPGAWRVVD